jgi:hypothetical protein
VRFMPSALADAQVSGGDKPRPYAGQEDYTAVIFALCIEGCGDSGELFTWWVGDLF